MKLATSSGDYAHYVSTVPETVREFKDSKFKYINLELDPFLSNDEGEFDTYVEELRLAAEYAGVTYSTAHAPLVVFSEPLNEELYDRNVKIVKRSIETCARLGINRTVVHAASNRAFDRRTLYEYNKRYYLDILSVAEKYGVRVMTENIDDDYDPLSTGREVRELVDYVNHSLLGVCWDTAHANLNSRVRAEGQYSCITDIGDKLWGLHISDNYAVHSLHHHSWPYAGTVNFDAVLQGLIDVNYDGFFTFEASYTIAHNENCSCDRIPWIHNGKEIRKVYNPSLDLKKKAVDLLYECGKYMLTEYGIFEES